jgi:diguanylate cyclase (GGDEF)-like protein
MNYLQRFYLVEAERYRVLRQDFKATEYYEKAIKQAKENEYIHEEALAYELTASFYLHKGQDKIAQAYMQEARYCYLHWGAIAKVKDLDNRYPQLLKIRFSEKQLPDFEGRISRPSSSSDDNISSVLDLASIMKVFQTLSQEIVLEKLLAKLMETVIKNAGAQTGILILDDYGHWVIQAAGELNSHPEVLQSISLDNCEILPISLINYVTRTKESVVLNNATRDNQFNSDIYIRKHQPQSVLCAPLIHQGKLTSIVYLENNLTTGAFTYERLEIVKLLCSQAAIYLENAKLYAEKEKYAQVLEQKVTERTQELEKANQELHRLAIVDGLTQIANRRRFNEYLIQQWQKLAKEKQPLCLILCDVDYFKLYNDFYGHQKGDDCLRQVAKAMADAIPHPQDLVARYGGEEFAVILPQCDVMDAFQLAEAVRTQVEKLKIPHVKSEVSNYISLSLGVGYMIPSLELSAEVLIAMADEALYAAKKQGRNQTMLKNIINKFIAEKK